MKKNENVWAIVLAAGEGRRLQGLTGGVPKQYASFGRRTCMLEWALARAARVAPPERVVTIVAEEHRARWEPLLSKGPFAANVVVQPANRGTAAGILLPALRALAQDEDATLVVLPSDHFVEKEDVFLDAITRAVDVSRRESGLALLGIEAELPETSYGWILPTPWGKVQAFIEKPPESVARGLMVRGGLWNAFSFAVRGTELVELCARTVPGVVRAFERGWPELARVYRAMPERDFSRDVLEHVTEKLSVAKVGPCGWTDLGTPERLRAFLGASVGAAG